MRDNIEFLERSINAHKYKIWYFVAQNFRNIFDISARTYVLIIDCFVGQWPLFKCQSLNLWITLMSRKPKMDLWLSADFVALWKCSGKINDIMCECRFQWSIRLLRHWKDGEQWAEIGSNSSDSAPRFSNITYRVFHQVVNYLLLTWKQKFCNIIYSISWNATINLMSIKVDVQPGGPHCRRAESAYWKVFQQDSRSFHSEMEGVDAVNALCLKKYNLYANSH